MAGRDNPFDMQIKLLMIGDSGKFEPHTLPAVLLRFFIVSHIMLNDTI
jgi:hypothetical protein